MTPMVNENDVNKFGPLVDSTAPYSKLVAVKFAAISCTLRTKWNGKINDIPATFKDYHLWQYGTRDHDPAPSRTPRSDALPYKTNNRVTALVLHLPLDGRSQ